MNSAPSTPLHLVTTEQIQKCLDENKNLIMAIMESQKTGKVADCAKYQAMLQQNLMYLAAIADAQPQGSIMPSQTPSSVLPPGNPLMVPTQGSSVMLQQQQQQQQQQQSGGPIAKLPFQLNALRPQDQQNLLQQLQQQQLMQSSSHFSIGGANNGLQLLMQPGAGNAGSLRDLRVNQAGGLDTSSGNGLGNSGLGPLEGRE